MNLDKDFTETYILGIRLINNKLYGTANSCLELLKQDKKAYPQYETILNAYINNLEVCLKTNNTPIVSDIKTSSLETKTEQREQDNEED